MHSHPDPTPEPRTAQPDGVSAMLRRISPTEFQRLGIAQIAYLRPLTDDEGLAGYAIHAADGTPLDISRDVGDAIGLAHEHGLILLPLH